MNTPDLKAQAEEIVDALDEAVKAFNHAKRIGNRAAKISPRHLQLLIIGACHGFGLQEHLALINRKMGQ